MTGSFDSKGIKEGVQRGSKENTAGVKGGTDNTYTALEMAITCDSDSTDSDEEVKTRIKNKNSVLSNQSSPKKTTSMQQQQQQQHFKPSHLPLPIKTEIKKVSKDMSTEEELYRAKKFKNTLSKRLSEEDIHTSEKTNLQEEKSFDIDKMDPIPPSPVNKNANRSPTSSPSHGGSKMVKKRKSFDEDSDDDFTGTYMYTYVYEYICMFIYVYVYTCINI